MGLVKKSNQESNFGLDFLRDCCAFIKMMFGYMMYVWMMYIHPYYKTMDTKNILEHLRSPGYYIVPNYFTKTECQRLVKLIDEQMKKYPQKNSERLQRRVRRRPPDIWS